MRYETLEQMIHDHYRTLEVALRPSAVMWGRLA